MSINKIILGGRLGADATTSSTTSGKEVVTFSLAIDNGYGDNKKTMWVKCKRWGEASSAFVAALHKGAKVVVVGRLEEPFCSHKENGKPVINVTVEQLEFVSGKNDSANEGMGSAKFAVPNDDLIPF